MSFKRLEDDKTWLHNLQQRRVADLFSDDIPEDEALLMKNGKFACLVCSNRPVFDTVAVLAIHRNGKKHTTNLEQFVAQKRELEALKQKRKHEEYVKSGKVREEKETKPVSLIDSLGPAYDPRVKRQKTKKGQMKQRLDMLGNSFDLKTIEAESTVTAADTNCLFSKSTTEQRSEISPCTSTGGPVEPTQSVREKKLHSKALPQTISDYRKVMADEDRLTRLKLKPYISKRPQKLPSRDDSINIAQNVWDTGPNGAQPNQVELRTGCNPSLCSILSKPPETICNTSKSQLNIRGHSKEKAHTQITGTAFNVKSSIVKPNVHVETKPVLTEEKRTAAERYLKATEAGWKRDRGGKWIKDATVEFDSDEEPPNIS